MASGHSLPILYHRLRRFVRNVTLVLRHMAVVRKRWRALMPNKAIKGPIRRRAGVGLDPVTLLLGGVRNQNFEQVVTGHTLV